MTRGHKPKRVGATVLEFQCLGVECLNYFFSGNIFLMQYLFMLAIIFFLKFIKIPPYSNTFIHLGVKILIHCTKIGCFFSVSLTSNSSTLVT